ncbi:hypothetical protein [Nitrosomonas oligotropha]|nr:hypothetical protein [Nitrosomonas oligotropha]
MRSILNGALRQVIAETAQAEGWASLEDKALAWARKSPSSPVAQLFVANVLLDHGYAVRGTEYASEVPADRMAQFRRYVQASREQLEKTKSVASIDPSWYEAMLSIAQYQRWSQHQHEALFAEAIKKEPEFLQTYFVASGWYSPKWGGSRNALNDFIVKSVSRFAQSEADAMYTRIHWWVSELGYFDRFEDAPVDCARMMRGAKVVAQAFPDQWNINNFALFAVRCYDKASFIHFAALIRSQPMLEVWEDRAYFDNAVSWSRH